MLNFCMLLSFNPSVFQTEDEIENAYQTLYKKLLQFYFAHPKYKIALFIPGPVLDYIQKKHPEYTQLLKELVSRKQLELLGSGYYNPAFPLLFHQDKTGQIELMTQTLRCCVGKRPRGMILVNSIWDNSMINCIQTCGMEYVLLDKSLIPKEKNEFLPLILNDQGKTIKVLPTYTEKTSDYFDEMPVDSYINETLKNVKKVLTKSKYNDSNRVYCLNIDEKPFKHLFNSGWIENFYKTIEENFSDKVEILLPSQYIQQTVNVISAFIPAGMRKDVAQWGKIPFEKVKLDEYKSVTIQDMLLTYKQNHTLYSRMLYLSLLINQAHGDKLRRRDAREKLWHAQSGEAYVCSPDGIFINNAVRQQCYRYLTEAEKSLRECNPKGKTFKENISSYDYNFDGKNDYICRMNNFTAVITPIGAQITELDIMKNSGNYADNLSRLAKFDKIDDEYKRGLFVEHLLTDFEYKDYKKGLPVGNGVFNRIAFNQLHFDAVRKEIKLIGRGEFSILNLPVSLRKKYIANSNGFTIQLILKNESPLPLKGVLVVENNFSQTDFTSTDKNSYKVEIISQDESQQLEIAKKPITTRAVSFVQVTDISNDISFVMEPNEDGEYLCQPIFFKRLLSNEHDLKIVANTLVSSMSWQVDLAAGMEMEKTINFTIIAPKKRKTAKKS